MYDREANRVSGKIWRYKNREHYREYQREYHRKRYHDNVERARAESRAKYQKHKAKGMTLTPEQREEQWLKDRAYYRAHREELCARSRVLYAAEVLQKYGRIARTNKRRK